MQRFRRVLGGVLALCLIVTGCEGRQDIAEDQIGAKHGSQPSSSSSPVLPGSALNEPNSTRPNVVLLVADDLGWADLGFRGSDIETPNIDRLAREGVILERFYSMPICTPTRSALMTARDPMKLGTSYAGFQPWHNGGVSPEELFMPEAFRAAGYQTAMVGKWHLGHTIEQHTPNARGFEHFFGHLNTQIDYYDFTVARGYDLQENGVSVKRDGVYATDLHGIEAARFVTELRDPNRPFLLYVPFLAPHAPMQAPQALEEKYAHRRNIQVKKRTYAAMVDSLDQAVGRILSTLDAQGLTENTIILFFSDNGGLEAFGADNGPYRGGKLETFEGGVRVSALMRWPARIAQGAVSHDVISVLDVFPTLAEIAGVKIGASKKLDGQSRWAALEAIEDIPRKDPLYFASNSPIFNRYHVSVLEEKWKLVQIINHQSVVTEVENFLFDIENDPAEHNNLSTEYPGEVARLSKKIVKWRSRHPINGIRVALAPHPGWRAPLDYAKAVIPSDTLNQDGYDTYVSGVRAKILQRMHGDKGVISYD